MIGLVVTIARLSVSWRLGVLEGERVVEAMLQGLVLGVVRRWRLRLAAVSGHQARSHPAIGKTRDRQLYIDTHIYI